MEELRLAIRDLHALEMGLPPEVALVSPRDKQPFVIILGADNADSPDSIMVYEQQGADGKRYVLKRGATIEVLTDEEFSKAKFAKNHKPGGAT